MRLARILAAGAVACLLAVTLPFGPASAQREGSDSVRIAGRMAQCKGARIVSDSNLPSEGAAAPGVVVLNPRLLNVLPGAVRLFVFSHECGHHAVGESELEADCWAVRQGVREGWLDAKGLVQVCESFEDAPPTATHPSGRKRCSNLDKCFATAVAGLQAGRPTGAAQPAAPSVAAPRLVSGPTLLSSGTVRHLWDAPTCKDPIGQIIQGKSVKAGSC
jgi:hypothetical protein